MKQTRINLPQAMFLTLVVLCSTVVLAAQGPGITENETKINELIRQLTLDEKISLIAGTGFDTVVIKRLGVPSLHMTDGPAGVRIGLATSFPSGMALGVTFEPAIVDWVGKAIAREAKAKGRGVDRVY